VRVNIKSIPLIQSILSDVDGAQRVLTEYLEDYASLVASYVRRTLCIDAFSVDPTARASFDSQTPDVHKNCFLFQLIHLYRRFRVVPVHRHPTPSGAANKDVRKNVDQIIEKVARADPRLS
jgi:hypothetical protein